MEPGHEDREYAERLDRLLHIREASMEPGHEDREYRGRAPMYEITITASMEPGHEDREYLGARRAPGDQRKASMEPGHEDREYGSTNVPHRVLDWPQWSPVMKTGNTWAAAFASATPSSLNGARS